MTSAMRTRLRIGARVCVVSAVLAAAWSGTAQAQTAPPTTSPPTATPPKSTLAESIARGRETKKVVTIVRDGYGVPTVYAPTDAAAVFGAMYARAEDEMARIETAHLTTTARAALARGNAGVASDQLVLSYEIPRLAQAECEAAPPEIRLLAQFAADALNLYLSEHPEYKPSGIPEWEAWMFFAGEYALSLYPIQQEWERLARELMAKPGFPSPLTAPSAQDGSNAWAIAPARTASKRAMLYINPHIPLDEPYEMDVRSKAGLHVTGMVAYGAGVLPRCGFNEHLGWALTVNYPDIADTYAVKFDVAGSPLAYRYGNSLRYATKWTEKIKVREGDQVSEREITCAKCDHGPLLYTVGETSYAIRLPRIEQLGAFEQWYRMARASNLAEWKLAVGKLGLVFHNLVYADDAGNIGYIYNAALPVRDPAFNWTGTLDGNDPRTDWKGYHPLEALPQVWNPPCGYVSSCNSSPFSVTAEGENADPAKYPKDMIGTDTGDARVAMSHDMLSRAKEWTLDDLQRAAFNTKVYAAETSRPQLLADFEGFRAGTTQVDERLVQAMKSIKDWDGTLTLESEASSLFMLWIDKIFMPAWRAKRKPGDLSLAMMEVIADLERDFGSWHVKWGDDNRLQRFDTNGGIKVSDSRESLPVAGGHGSVGVSFCFLARTEQSKLRYGYHGNSYVAVVEFGDGPTARTIVPFGTSRDPKSTHFADQMWMYARGEMRDWVPFKSPKR